jgi:predicted O-linked N-acetylglucosamine transferase (SPINDLY family)
MDKVVTLQEAEKLFFAGRYSEAIVLFNNIDYLENNPNHKKWYVALAILLQGKKEEEVSLLSKVEISSEPIISEFLAFNHKVATEFGHRMRNYDAALKTLQIGLDIDPTNNDLLRSTAGFYIASQQYLPAIQVAAKYFDIVNDSYERIFANHLRLQSIMATGGSWEESISFANLQIELIELLLTSKLYPKYIGDSNRLFLSTFFLHYTSDDPTRNRILQNNLFKLLQRNISDMQVIKDRYPTRAISSDKRVLKIGYLSYCLRKHSVGWLSRSIFKYHDRERFSVHTYFLLSNSEQMDTLQTEIQQNSDKYYHFGNDIFEVANKIYEDEIDILIDLDSNTLDITCEIMCLKPAPIQVTWLGLDASGIPAVDYFIADRYVLPDNAQDYYSEKIVRLPNSYISVEGFEVLFPTLRREEINIAEDQVVYLSAQVGLKRNPNNIKLQMQIIKDVPNSILLIKGSSDQKSVEQLYYQLAEENEISRDCLRFLPQVDGEQEHRANLAIADVILDTYPYNGATTTMETLWMCIPLVTRVGQQFAARNSYTMMMNAGITEGIAWKDEEYVNWGVRFGTDEKLRKQVFWKLKESRKTSPLWNAKQFTSDLEDAYQQMWLEHLEKPE